MHWDGVWWGWWDGVWVGMVGWCVDGDSGMVCGWGWWDGVWMGMVGWCVDGDGGMMCGWGWWGGKEADYERQNVSIITI